MKNSKKVALSVVIIGLIVLLGIMTYLYFDMRNTARNNLDQLLQNAEDYSHEMGELSNEIDALKNQINKTGIASATNTTSAYIPEGVPVENVNNNAGTKAVEFEFNRSPENVTIEVLKDTVTRKSAEILITDKNEDTYGWGENFSLQKKVNGNWEELKMRSDKLLTFNALAYLPDENHQLKMKVDYGEYYGTLEDGIYRIVKAVYDGEDVDLYSDEFEVR